MVAAPILLAVAGAVAVAAPQRGASVGEVFEVLEGRDHMEIIPTMPELGLPWVFEQ